MSRKKRKKSCKKHTLEKLLLATALIQLITAVVSLIDRLTG